MKGERFEYETTMLLELKRRNVSFGQVPIRTIYENHNKGTHFRPIQDSLQILHLMLKFVAASLGSFVVDIGAFAILSMLLESLTHFPTNIPLYHGSTGNFFCCELFCE